MVDYAQFLDAKSICLDAFFSSIHVVLRALAAQFCAFILASDWFITLPGFQAFRNTRWLS